MANYIRNLFDLRVVYLCTCTTDIQETIFFKYYSRRIHIKNDTCLMLSSFHDSGDKSGIPYSVLAS